MITSDELISLGFEFFARSDEWCRESILICLEDGKITYIRQHENYHGIKIAISTVTDLNTFLAYVEE